MDLRLLAKETIMRAKGYKKVALKDTKGVLTPENNHKWVKVTTEGKQDMYLNQTEILPSGTQVKRNSYNRNLLHGITSADNQYMHNYTSVKKPNGGGTTIYFANGGKVHLKD